MGVQLLTVPEVAARLRVHRGTVYRLIAEGAFPVVRVRSVVRVTEEALAAYVREATDPPRRR